MRPFPLLRCLAALAFSSVLAPAPRALAQAEGEAARPLEVWTYNGFDPERVEGTPIDFIYSGPGLVPKEAQIVLARTPGGRWPSDHFPVRAVFE